MAKKKQKQYPPVNEDPVVAAFRWVRATVDEKGRPSFIIPGSDRWEPGALAKELKIEARAKEAGISVGAMIDRLIAERELIGFATFIETKNGPRFLEKVVVATGSRSSGNSNSW
jgi:hypothetical protein